MTREQASSERERAPAEACIRELEQAFADYQQDVETYQRNSKPTDGLLGFGRSLQHDACHDRLDRRVQAAVESLVSAEPSPEEAKQALQQLLARDDAGSWPLAAQWMLRAIERHGLPLIPFLSKADSAAFLSRYTACYKPWDRLPNQREVCKALKARAAAQV